ncbi:peptidoglycan-binding protein [Isoptericola sediminis]|nr:peptidoglycan-binding protein [Isoptericola sediminis]
MRFGGRTFSNGDLPSAVLSELSPRGVHGTSGRSRAYLRKDAARSWNRAIRQVRSETGLDLTVRGWNRSRAEQELFFFQRYRRGASSPFRDYRFYRGVKYGRVSGAAAAVPGFSNHGWGLAVDVNDFGGVGEFGNARRVKAYPILKTYGWTETEGRRVSEPWHLVYDPAADRAKGGGKPRVTKAPRRKPTRPPTIKRRSRQRAWVALWREFLTAEKGSDPGTGTAFDGTLHDATTQWQKRHDLEPDGIVGPKTWYTATSGVRTGSRGSAVQIAQRIGGLRGSAVDGVAGSVFASRWKQIQRWLGVEADAVIGPKTVAALIAKG